MNQQLKAEYEKRLEKTREEAVRRGFSALLVFGLAPRRVGDLMYENDRKISTTERCTFADVWLEKDWAEIGQIYCLTDIAIREGYSANVKFSPVKNILEGDPYCQSLSVYRDITKKGQ